MAAPGRDVWRHSNRRHAERKPANAGRGRNCPPVLGRRGHYTYAGCRHHSTRAPGMMRLVRVWLPNAPALVLYTGFLVTPLIMTGLLSFQQNNQAAEVLGPLTLAKLRGGFSR